MNEELERIALRTRLAQLDAERAALTKRLNELTDLPATSGSDAARITAASAAVEKIALFRRLFAGRTDVFPVRWDNPKTERSGYAPACADEWVRGVCNKPQVKCSECSNQAFIAVSDKQRRIWKPVARIVCLRHWSDPGPGKAVMSGSSFPSLFLPAMPGSWAPIC